MTTPALTDMPQDLDGLILRQSTPADADGIVEFSVRVFDESLRDDTRKLVRGDYPTGAADWVLVEDPVAGKIVSTVCLIPQTWAYRGLAFDVGRPEIVATDPEYRRRGLVRRQFDAMHRISAACFPDLTFLQLVFGRRRMHELRHAFPDCTAKHETGVLLDCLFPDFSRELWYL